MTMKSEDITVVELEMKTELYHDLDTQPVSRKELNSWYAFNFTSESTSLLGMSLLLPLVIHQLTSLNAFDHHNHNITCNVEDAFECDVLIGSLWVDTTSFFMGTVVIATLIQMFLFIGMGSYADYGDVRKKFLVGFSLVGSVAALAFLLIFDSTYYLWSAFLYIILSVCFGTSYVFTNAYIPVLVRSHPEYLEELENPDATKQSTAQVFDKVTNHVSTRGFIWGYVGSIIAIVVAAGLVILVTEPPFTPTYAMQIGVALCGAFWLIGTIIVQLNLRPRPGPPFPQGANIVTYSFVKATFFCFSLAGLFTLTRFSISFNESTLAAVAVLFAQSRLGFTNSELIVIAIEVPVIAALGNVFWNFIQTRFKISTKNLLLTQNSLYALVPLYICLGLIPDCPIGLKFKIEIYFVAGFHAFFVGATQSSCRSLFSQLLPQGYEGEFFSLYEITDKSSAWIGPVVVAAIDANAGNKLYAFLFLSVLFLLPIAFFYMVDVEKGIIEGVEYGNLQRKRERWELQ